MFVATMCTACVMNCRICGHAEINTFNLNRVDNVMVLLPLDACVRFEIHKHNSHLNNYGVTECLA